MKYEYYDIDSYNCVIRSISKALGKDPIDVYNELCIIDKEYSKEKVFEKYLLKNNFEVVNIFKNKNLLNTNLIGTNIAYVKDKDWHHMVCVIDNTLYDKHDLNKLENMKIIKVYRFRG